MFGLSLCIQGTHYRAQEVVHRVRFIPVYTGNALSVLMFSIIISVYPCVYRERFVNTFFCLASNGLSLCIQGTLPDLLSKNCTWRFIPVYTGNAKFDGVNEEEIAVYPCVYRERCIEFCNIAHYLRFIPVYTGNTHSIFNALVICTVYPCVYREHSNYNILFYN